MSKLNQRHLTMARQHLAVGNAGSYARQMRCAIDSALSTRVQNQFRVAALEDGYTESDLRRLAI